jgi:luciferase family oxidoreductase group 1
VLEALAPGRIDLGVGRAPGGDMRIALALNPNAAHAAELFPQQVSDLQAWTSGLPLQGLSAHPRPAAGAPCAEIWILGSSNYGAQLAAHHGLPYAYAYFFMDGQGVEQALDLYRRLYRPSQRHPRPQATICVWALAADTEAQARHHALSRERWRLDRQHGKLAPLAAAATVQAQGFSDEEWPGVQAARATALVGTGAQVAAGLRELARRLDLGEIVINTWAHEPSARRRSYALLAQEFGLPETTNPPEP